MSDYTNIERELDWDDVIKSDGTAFEVLPEGDYAFTVEKFERTRHPGSDKIPPCKKVVLTLNLNDGTHSGTVTANLYLYSTVQWKLSQFFVAIGVGKRGEEIKMNWNVVVGSSGVCKIKTCKWTDREGREREGNEVDTFYDPEEAPAIGNGGFTEAPKGDGELPASWGAGF